jgi:hypothetical protein
VRVRHAKGIADFAVLLARPGQEVHVRTLAGVDEIGFAPSAQAALDETAVAQYRQRLRDLEDDLDEADRHGDLACAERLAAERDALVDQLTKAFGLGGRAPSAGSDPDERLRKAMSALVKASIDRLERLNPALGRHSATRSGPASGAPTNLSGPSPGRSRRPARDDLATPGPFWRLSTALHTSGRQTVTTPRTHRPSTSS